MIVVLVLSAVALLVAAALIYMVTAGTRISGERKGYANAREAGKGCGALFMELIETRYTGQPYTDFNNSVNAAGLNLLTTTTGTCTGTDSSSGQQYSGLSAKLLTVSTSWQGCDTTTTINPGNAATYDMSAVIGTTTQYNCYAKIISATQGNSGGTINLRTKGVVSSGGEIAVLPVPYLYAIEVLAQQTTNPDARSRISILFQF